MENIDLNKIKKVMLSYKALDSQDKKIVNKKIDAIWSDAYNEFMEKCMEDKELVELYDKLQSLYPILNYNIQEDFENYAYTEFQDDPDYSSPVYMYDEDYFNECKNLSENWDEIKKEIQDKIKLFETSKFVLFREDKIRNLKIDLKDKAFKVEHYNKCMLLQQQHLDLLAEKSKIFDPIEKRYNELLTKYATQVLEKYLNSTPSIACVEHNSYISSSIYSKGFNMTALNKLCNEVHNQVNESIKNDLSDFMQL